MKMLHATPAKNVKAILRRGILCSKSKAAASSIWLCAPSLFGAAVAHAVKRHRVKPEAVAVLEVDVPKRWLRKGYRKGVRHTGGRDIPPERVKWFTISLRWKAKPTKGRR